MGLADFPGVLRRLQGPYWRWIHLKLLVAADLAAWQSLSSHANIQLLHISPASQGEWRGMSTDLVRGFWVDDRILPALKSNVATPSGH